MKKLIILLIIFLGISAELLSKVLIITVKGGISPATSSFISSGIDRAENERAEALIIELNTPGGLLESTRDIVQSMSTSLVIVYGPSEQDGFCRVFITLFKYCCNGSGNKHRCSILLGLVAKAILMLCMTKSTMLLLYPPHCTKREVETY